MGIEYCLDEGKMYNYGRSTINNCRSLNTGLQNLTKTINNFKNHKNVQGKTGIAINAYLEEVHLNLIAGLRQICVQYERMAELYELNASLIDSDQKAKLPSEELQFCQSDIRLRYSEMEYVIYDFNEIIRQISGDVKGLILVNKTTATDSVVFIQDYINQNRNSIETFDANFCSTLISPLEDLILSTDKLIRRYETKQKKIENPGTYNNRITNYTKGDISKLSEAVEFTKAFTECAAFQDANKELLDQAEDNHIDYLEANKDEAEARKKAGLTKMVTGAGEIALVGLTVATAGAAAPVATIVMLGGVGLTTVNAGANIYQGYQEYQLGSAGDTTTKTNHLILDGLFGGNEDLYLAYNVASAAMIVGGCVMSSSGAVKAGETVRLESEAVSDVSKGTKATSKIAEVEDGINAVEVGKISESVSKTPSEIARSWQGTGKYPGIDDYVDVAVEKGTVLYRGEPNGTEYFTTLDAIEQSGRDATKLFEGLQVEKNPIHGYRGEMQGYIFNEDVASAYGITNANPQFGKGGLPQYYVPDVQDLIDKGILTPVDNIKLNK